MEENLISKKELLQLTGISYGSLYRWKRKKLIPDEWFIHKATFTGQETFFPRELILERIDKIQNLKDGMSLDDIAETFSPAVRRVEYTAGQAAEEGIVSRAAAELFVQHTGDRGPYGFEKLFTLYLFHRLLESGELTREEAFSCVSLSEKLETQAGNRLIAFRRLGVTFLLAASEQSLLLPQEGMKPVLEIPLSGWMAQLKELLGAKGVGKEQGEI